MILMESASVSPLFGAGIATIGKADHATAQPLYRRLEGQAGTGGRLEEAAADEPAGQ